MSDSQLEIPKAVRETLPQEAQVIYAEAYARSWSEFSPQGVTGMSRQAVASRDAWTAVNREFVKDDETHLWHRRGQAVQPAAARPRRSAFAFLRGLFERG